MVFKDQFLDYINQDASKYMLQYTGLTLTLHIFPSSRHTVSSMAPNPKGIENGIQSSYSIVIFALLGMYLWDFILSLDFDWQFLSGKKKPRWPMIFYFLGRYLTLTSLLGYISVFLLSTESESQNGEIYTLLYVLFQLTAVCGIGLASINLAIRVIAVWEQKAHFVVAILVLILVHWAFIIAALIQAAKDAHAKPNLITLADSVVDDTFPFTLAPPSSSNGKLCLVIPLWQCC